MRGEGGGPRPSWWLLYLIGALVVAGIGLVEIFVDGEALREFLESLTVRSSPDKDLTLPGGPALH